VLDNTGGDGNCEQITELNGALDCCYICPCSEMPTIHCHETLNTWSNTYCFADQDQNEVCNCVHKNPPKTPPVVCPDQPGNICKDELEMDLESPKCSVMPGHSFDDLKRQVYNSRTCGDNLKGFVEGTEEKRNRDKLRYASSSRHMLKFTAGDI